MTQAATSEDINEQAVSWRCNMPRRQGAVSFAPMASLKHKQYTASDPEESSYKDEILKHFESHGCFASIKKMTI